MPPIPDRDLSQYGRIAQVGEVAIAEHRSKIERGFGAVRPDKRERRWVGQAVVIAVLSATVIR